MIDHTKFTNTALSGLLSVLLALPTPALAWGYEGHRVVAAIARGYLTPAVQAKVDALLAADTDTLEAHDMMSAATWADTYRNSHRETSQWHFADIELGGADIDGACFGHPPSANPASAGPPQACLIDRLDAFEAELADPSTPQAERIVALKFVLHFVGDLHQPLHVSDNQDKGGNCVRLALGGSRTTTLHSYWDTGLVQALGLDPLTLAEKLRASITPAGKASYEQGNSKSWALESHALAGSAVYKLGSAPGCNSDAGPISPPAGYEEAAKAIVANQLQRAGVRLALVLNRTFVRDAEDGLLVK